MIGNAASTSTTARGVALAALVLALLVRLAVPVGWMPSPAGGFAVTLCTGSGAVEAWIDPEGAVHKLPDSKMPTAKHPCIFAAIGGPLLAAATPILAAPAPALLAAGALGLAETDIGRGLAAPPPPPTGPPASL